MKMSAYNELVEKAKLYNHMGLAKAEECFKKACGDEYPDAVIEIALYNARGLYMIRNTSELVYLLANNEEFKQLEQDVFKGMKGIFDLLIDFVAMHGLKPAQSNEILLRVSKHFSEKLFNLTPLHKEI